MCHDLQVTGVEKIHCINNGTNRTGRALVWGKEQRRALTVRGRDSQDDGSSSLCGKGGTY